MNVAYAYRWWLNDADFAQVCEIIEALRQHALDLGIEMVSDLSVQPEPCQVVFVATMPGATQGRYGLASAGNLSWSWNGAVIVSSARTIGEFHQMAARLGIEVIECYAGMIFESKKNALGKVETEQRSAFDPDGF